MARTRSPSPHGGAEADAVDDVAVHVRRDVGLPVDGRHAGRSIAPTATHRRVRMSGRYADAACVDLPIAMFFPHQGESADPAKAVCAECPVQRQCLDDHQREQFGIFGGTTPNDRGFPRWRR